MNEKTNKTVRLYYGIALGVMTAIVGALFIWQVLDNYFTGPVGDNKFTFTQEGLSERFFHISPAFWIWAVMIVGGFIVWEVFPVKPKKSPYKDPRYSLMRLKKRMPVNVGEELAESYGFIKREEKILKILWLCCSSVALAGIVYSIVYLALPSSFTVSDNATKEVLQAAKNILPWFFSVFVFASAISVYEGISAKKQIEHAKKLASGNKPVQLVHGKIYEILNHKYFKLGIQVCVGCVAFSFIIAGACNGNVSGIFDKAVNICLECIGLG